MMKNVLITGVSGGIGKGLVEKLLKNGYSIIGLDKVLSDDIKAIANEYHGNLFLHEADLMNSDSLGSLINGFISIA